MSEIAELYRSETYSQRVAAEVRAHASRMGFEQKDLAKTLGLNPSGVTNRMRGRVAFTLDELATLADLFGVEPSDLLPRRPGSLNSFARPGETGSGEGDVRRQGLEPRTRWFGAAFGELGDELGLTPDSLTIAPVIPLRSRKAPRPGDWHATIRRPRHQESGRETLSHQVASCS